MWNVISAWTQMLRWSPCPADTGESSYFDTRPDDNCISMFHMTESSRGTL